MNYCFRNQLARLFALGLEQAPIGQRVTPSAFGLLPFDSVASSWY
jgi:hypothetical protein